jgi:hypothetical protein
MVQLQPSAVEEIFLLIVDTNVLLHQLDALQQFVLDIEHHLPFTLQIVIPGIVISELDRCVYSAIILTVPLIGDLGQTENAR